MTVNRDSIHNRKTLEKAVRRAVFFGVVSALIVLLLLEGALFIIPTFRLYKQEMRHVGDIATELLDREYIVECFQKTKDIYYSTPEEIRADQYSDEYVNLILTMIDDKYKEKRNLLSSCRAKAEYYDISYVFYDEEMERLVFVFDGNEKNRAFLPAQWVSDETGMIESLNTITKTMNSAWIMPISYGKATGWSATEYRGFYDEAGNLVGYIAFNVEVNSVARQMTTFLAVYSPVMAIFTILIATRMARWIKKRLLSPIGRLTEKAREYNAAESSVEDGEYGSIFEGLSMNTGDEMEELWRTMVDMENDVATAMKTVREEAALKERIATELDLGRNIQMGALPVHFDEFSGEKNFKIFASMNPAKEIGGDFYDFFYIDENHVGLVIADVSGKGVPASLFMMISKVLIKSRTVQGGTPATILKDVNNSLCEDNPNSMFITAWLGIMDTRTGEIQAANAGHEYPFVTDTEGVPAKYVEPHGVVMGVMEDMEYEDYSFAIPRGGMLFVYTDGVPEAQNEREEMFGMERLGEALRRFKDLEPGEVIASMKGELDSFEGSADQFDDITMMAIRFGD